MRRPEKLEPMVLADKEQGFELFPRLAIHRIAEFVGRPVPASPVCERALGDDRYRRKRAAKLLLENILLHHALASILIPPIRGPRAELVPVAIERGLRDVAVVERRSHDVLRSRSSVGLALHHPLRATAYRPESCARLDAARAWLDHSRASLEGSWS